MIRKPKGTNDILPKDVSKWHFVEEEFRDICKRYNFKEIRTPMFESTELFKKGAGETSDIVQKEMFNVVGLRQEHRVEIKNGDLNILKEKIKDGLALKPEGTAPVVRSFIENNIFAEKQPSKLFYITPCFRYERPQAGRLRQFHQFGIETFSAEDATADAEVIALADNFLTGLGLKNIDLRINSVGCPKCRPKYDKILKEYYKKHLDDICLDCQERYDTNPLRLLDCKVENCQPYIEKAPKITENLCDECSDHFEELKLNLDIMDIDYIVDEKIVRGLDYYTKTAFEFISSDLGAQSTVCGGGRYNGLVKSVDGPETPGVGFGMGIERLLMILEAQETKVFEKDTLDIFVVTFDKVTRREAIKLSAKLRKKGISIDIDHLGRSFKQQFRYSDSLNSKFSIILGGDEIENNIVSIKNMETGKQVEIDMDNIDKIVELVKEKKDA